MKSINGRRLNPKTKTVREYYKKFLAVAGAVFMLSGAVFFMDPPERVKAQSPGNPQITGVNTGLVNMSNGCKASAYFAVTDMAGTAINSLANVTSTRLILYVKYTFDITQPNCRDRVYKHRFRQVSNSGQTDFAGQEFTVGAINGVVERKYTAQTTGFKDFTKWPEIVQNNGSFKVEAYLATQAGVELLKSPGVLVSVGNSTTTPAGQSLTGQQTFGSVEIAPEKSKGLVPCGRDSAVTGNPEAGPRPDDTCTVKDIFSLIFRVTNYLVMLAGFFAVFQIVRSSFSMVLSQGNPEGITSSKKHLINSVLGLVLVFMAYLLINTIVGFVGLEGGSTLLQSPLEYINGGENSQIPQSPTQ